MSDTAAVVASALVKRFGAVAAVAGMDLVVPTGSCFGLIGENGAGKTTFIKLLLGICRPDGGAVSVLGGSPDDVAVRRRIGYLPERLQLPSAFTPVSFLRSVARLKGLSSAEARDAIPRVLSWVGLSEEAWSRRTGGFSKGMRQRTGLAAALLGDPALLVLDEPTDGIDPLGRAQIRDVIVEAKKRGSTVFLNSHLLSETERICDHVAVVSAGRVVVSGPLASLRSKEAYRVRFRAESADLSSLRARAASYGFEPDEEAVTPPEQAAFRFQGRDPTELSRALQAALGAGLVVVEVTPLLKDLEAILAEAVHARRAGEGSRP